LGFPIRTSPDHSSVVNFPGLIADSYVLLRLLMPRHPPCALSSLSFLDIFIATKMLASTMQFSRYGRHRVSLVAYPPAIETASAGRSTMDSARGERAARDPSGPNSVLERFGDRREVPLQRTGCTDTRLDRDARIVDVPLNEPRRLETFARETTNGQPSVDDCRELLRKEVIQPHLPVRLPCYDFVPIASPTFDGSLHKGWATGFGCCRLS
jgi:hypothetical protein